jgi:hypothetical protein
MVPPSRVLQRPLRGVNLKNLTKSRNAIGTWTDLERLELDSAS